MARVSDAEVKEILDTSIVDLSAFISAANILVSNLLVGKGLTDSHLKEIERWLAAHFTAILEKSGRVTSEDIAGEIKEQYGGKHDMGLQATLYGQQVAVLDTTGTLSQSLGKPGVIFEALP